MAPSPLLRSPSRESPYWNEYTETMPRAELDRLHLRRIKRLLRYAYDRVPFYHDLYKKAGLHPDDIQTLDDFNRYVPTIDKQDIVAAQQVNPPFGDASALPDDYLLYRFQTSGSTGVPLAIPFSHHSSLQYGQQWVYAFWAVGIRPRDSFYFAFPWGNFAGFWSTYWGVRLLGATVYSGGGLDTGDRIKQILDYKPTVLVSTPTYALYMAETARKLGVDLSQTSIRITFHAGEPGVGVKATREAIEQAWGARAFELYGVAEVGAIAPGCPHQLGCHLAEDQSYATVLGPDGKPVASGEVGENVVTSYIQFAQPMIKYRTHDLVRPIYERCSCGRTWLLYRDGVLGRTDHMIIIRGTNVYPTAVESLIGQVPGVSSNYEVHVHSGELNDEVMVKVEAQAGYPAADYGALQAVIERTLFEHIRVKIAVTVCAPGTLPRYELKAKRFFDHRHTQRKWQLDT